MSVNQIWLERKPDNGISVGQLYHFEDKVCMVIKITVPKEDPLDFKKDYFAITSFETGWVGLLSDSLQELEDKLFDDSYEQLKSKVIINPD
jgi:hypothetical protein